MKTLLTDRHPFSKLMILTLTSCLASAFYVFNRFSQYDLLVFVAMSLALLCVLWAAMDVLDYLIVRWFGIRINLLLLMVASVLFYYFLLRYKTYNAPREGMLAVVAIMSSSTYFFCLLIDHYRKKHLLPILLLVIIQLCFFTFEFGGGFGKHLAYEKIVSSNVSSIALEVSESSDYNIIDFSDKLIDLSELIDDDVALKEQVLGYTYDEVPIAGRLYLPVSDEPVPLVVIIHGNHMLPTASYLGYNYLGEYLGSRGIALVSLDQRALNGYLSNDLTDDNPLRAIMLLEGIKYLQENYAGSISFEDITLAGHSRGGEAIVIASSFNTMETYQSYPLNYQFDIENLLAIAPTYNQYSLSRYPTDVNYVVLHGAHDQDVRTFRGEQTFRRINVSGESFKSSLYIANANHGQFNSQWGQYDTRLPNAFNTNTNNLLSASQQEQLVSIFAYNLVHGNKELFFDVHSFLDQLPETWYSQQAQSGDSITKYDFERDSEVEVGIITSLMSRDTDKSRVNKLLQIDVEDSQSVVFEIDSTANLLSFDIVGTEKIDGSLLVAYADGTQDSFDLSKETIMLPYVVQLSKWEIVFNIESDSIMLETVQVELKDNTVDSITFNLVGPNVVYLDNIRLVP
ncbi:MAG: hypothetical protein GX775_02005 [Erysipelothrix sp.]|nr:hypothetical protein [Erysipelothrix sp.]